MKKKILVICDYYLPSVNSGGGMWTVVNIVERFSYLYDFSVITRNYDSPGNTDPYTTVTTNAWNDIYGIRVYYAGNDKLSPEHIAKLFNDVDPDCVFLNSVFGTPVVKFLIARKEKLIRSTPVVLSPTGNLAVGGMRNKWLKKKAFLTYAKLTGLYREIIWKVSTELEADEVKNVFGVESDCQIAPDLTPLSILPEYTFDQKPFKENGHAKLIFLSRIVRKKNILFLLRCLRSITEGSIALDVVGPVEDPGYWKECLEAIDRLPKNISVTIRGAVSYSQGLEILCENHFFVLPTLNENFGYVFVESMAAGCPIVTSDQTVWGDVVEKKAGWVTPVSNKDKWISVIRECVEMDPAKYREMSSNARIYAENWLKDASIEDATFQVFDRALKVSQVR